MLWGFGIMDLQTERRGKYDRAILDNGRRVVLHCG